MSACAGERRFAHEWIEDDSGGTRPPDYFVKLYSPQERSDGAN